MALQRWLPVTEEGRIERLQVVGFQGAVDPASTPAQRAPVIVDELERLSRVVDVGRGLNPTHVLIETVEPPLPKESEGALPGVATRLGPFPARLHGVVAIVGKSERPLVHKIDLDRLRAPERVAGFLRWLRDDQRLDGAPFGRPAPGLWACYLTEPERGALWKALHAEIYASLRAAVQARDHQRMSAGAFWLSRVVVDPETDLFKVAEALHRAGSQHWKFMLREGLRQKDEAAWAEGLADAAYAFDGPPRPAPEQPRRYRAREAVRQGAANR